MVSKIMSTFLAMKGTTVSTMSMRMFCRVVTAPDTPQ